jgi:dTDP-glucose 4,6-dehydratase
VYFLDSDESAFHGLTLNLSDTAASHYEKCFIADIRDRGSIQDVIKHVSPTIVIHAAALKHFLILERFWREGYLTNILGILNLAEICVEKGIVQFVNISTDKAANPYSILGKIKN